jgi:hypothetical protein
MKNSVIHASDTPKSAVDETVPRLGHRHCLQALAQFFEVIDHVGAS